MNPALLLFLRNKAIQAPLWAAGSGLLSYARSREVPSPGELAFGKISAAFQAEEVIEDEVKDLLPQIGNPFNDLFTSTKEEDDNTRRSNFLQQMLGGNTTEINDDSLALAYRRNAANEYAGFRAKKHNIPKVRKPKKVRGI